MSTNDRLEQDQRDLRTYLTDKERAELDRLEHDKPLAAAALRQVDRILRSQTFRPAHEELKAFLGFVVAQKLLGHAVEIKETVIAMRIWNEAADYDPGQTSKVRMAAKSLRKRLSLYYGTEGQRDPVEIRLPDSGYVPEIRDRRLLISIALLQEINPNGSHHLCAALTDEIVYRLNNMGAVEATRIDTIESLSADAHYTLRGCLAWRPQETATLNLWLLDSAADVTIWEDSFQEHRDHILALSKRVADAVFSILRQQGKTPINPDAGGSGLADIA